MVNVFLFIEKQTFPDGGVVLDLSQPAVNVEVDIVFQNKIFCIEQIETIGAAIGPDFGVAHITEIGEPCVCLAGRSSFLFLLGTYMYEYSTVGATVCKIDIQISKLGCVWKEENLLLNNH